VASDRPSGFVGARRAVDAFLLGRDLTMTIGTRALPAPGPDEAVVRVHSAGVCGSDLHVLRSGDWVADDEWPATLGHEIYGTVEEAPTDGSLEVGDHVVADSKIPCGRCAPCVEGRPDFCIDVRFVGEARPGGFATHCVLPSALLHSVPETLHESKAALAEPLAVVLHGLSHLRSEPRRVAILGHGPVGALTHIQLRRTFPDAEVTVAEPAPLRGQLAGALGARTVDTARELPEARFDTVIDAAGYPASLTDALSLVAPRGQVLLMAITRRPVEVVPADLVERGIALHGSNAFCDELPAAIAALAADPRAYEPVITRAVSLDELPAVLTAQLTRRDEVKVVLCP
jgi:threonine dehydrogenase-like Zn-dependent dehydrogenase